MLLATRRDGPVLAATSDRSVLRLDLVFGEDGPGMSRVVLVHRHHVMALPGSGHRVGRREGAPVSRIIAWYAVLVGDADALALAQLAAHGSYPRPVPVLRAHFRADEIG